mgnify:CR=1 FL=1|tara:strand:+ start:1708 stop:2133 length:426 start_codon:yes stop_codon:yes gene_type:complete
MARTGRPSKCTPAITERICKAIRLGLTYEYAANYAGIDKSTFFRWMAFGRNAKRGKYRDFHDAVKEANATAAMESLAVIKKAAYDGRWTAAAWLLERRFGYVRTGVEQHDLEDDLHDSTSQEELEERLAEVLNRLPSSLRR